MQLEWDRKVLGVVQVTHVSSSIIPGERLHTGQDVDVRASSFLPLHQGTRVIWHAQLLGS